ncbi:MAG TPA: alpha/beta fold hydrolase, partial [Proteobacteria bacterium]|nr:alpha/beta fold hydrolase [Pseudomonadota bacterium]
MGFVEAVLTFVFWLIVIVFGIAALIRLLGWLWQRIYLVERKPDETHWIRTLDGWRIALHRFVPENKTQNTPVLLCHGLAANSLVWNFSEENSLARYLNRRGFEVWAIDLRGAGASASSPDETATFKPRPDFHDYLEHDLYRAVEHIKRTSKSRRVHLVGHSMGGMLGYAYI